MSDPHKPNRIPPGAEDHSPPSWRQQQLRETSTQTDDKLGCTPG